MIVVWIYSFGTYNTTSPVLTTTPWKPPQRTGSAIIGSVSLTVIFGNRTVMRGWPFSRMGLIFSAYHFCSLKDGSESKGREGARTVVRRQTHSVPLMFSRSDVERSHRGMVTNHNLARYDSLHAHNLILALETVSSNWKRMAGKGGSQRAISRERENPRIDHSRQARSNFTHFADVGDPGYIGRCSKRC